MGRGVGWRFGRRFQLIAVGLQIRRGQRAENLFARLGEPFANRHAETREDRSAVQNSIWPRGNLTTRQLTWIDLSRCSSAILDFERWQGSARSYWSGLPWLSPRLPYRCRSPWT